MVIHGGLRLSALFGDQPRPLRPSHCGTEKSCGSICGPPAFATLAAECGSALRGARRLGAPSPCVGAASGRPGRTRSHLTGAGVPPRGACPAGARFISFSAEKETGLDSSSERIPFRSIPLGGYPLHSIRSSSPHKSCAFVGAPGGPVYAGPMDENGGQRLSYDCGDPSRPLRPALVTQGQACALFTRRLRVPLSGPGWSGASLQRRGRLDRARRPRRTAALCRESCTTRRPQDRTKSPSLFHHGTAVTAGAGPHHSA